MNNKEINQKKKFRQQIQQKVIILSQIQSQTCRVAKILLVIKSMMQLNLAAMANCRKFTYNNLKFYNNKINNSHFDQLKRII